MSRSCAIQLRKSSEADRSPRRRSAAGRPNRIPRAAASAGPARRAWRRLGVEIAGADPADLAFDACAASAARRSPPRPPAWASRTIAARTSRTAGRSPSPGSRTCAVGRSRGRDRTAPARSRRAGAVAAEAGEAAQGLLALLEVGVGEGDHGFVEVGVVGDFRVGDVKALPKSSACGISRWIGATEAARDTCGACGAAAGGGTGAAAGAG